MLDPILFLIYIIDLPDQIFSQVRLFADDTTIYLTMAGGDSHIVLQNDLNSLSSWESRWDIEFNPSEYQMVRVTTSRRPIDKVWWIFNGSKSW